MRVNFGAGRKVLDGYYNIDSEQHPKADRAPELIYVMEFDDGKIRQQIPLEDGCADEVMSIHVLEHVHRFNADAVIAEFKRLLKDGGKLVLEVPNIEVACRNLINGTTDQLSLWAIYGSPKSGGLFVSHLWGYSPKTLTELVAAHGFKDIRIMPPQYHMKNRDFRLEAIKA
jgi:ubiquinone/menaquinone biosynthesis C-methylase UbiE